MPKINSTKYIKSTTSSHTQIHTHTHKHTQTNTHTHTHTDTHTYTHTHTHIHTHASRPISNFIHLLGHFVCESSKMFTFVVATQSAENEINKVNKVTQISTYTHIHQDQSPNVYSCWGTLYMNPQGCPPVCVKTKCRKCSK